MKNRFIFTLTIFCFFLLNGHAHSETRPLARGARLPDAVFLDHLSKEERSYLGLSRKTKFSLKDISGTLLLIEVFSTYCTSCPRNVPVLNAVYSSVEDDPALRGKVKVISIAVGNTGNEIDSFKREYKVLYPVLSDLPFIVHKALGNPRVPYTILVKKNMKGDVVVDAHQGEIGSPDSVLHNIKSSLSETISFSAPSRKSKGHKP